MRVRDALVRGQPETSAAKVTDIEGMLPERLDGVLFRNGAGEMQVGDDPLSFLDGYGLVAALEVAGGKAFFRSAFVDSDVRREELAAGRMLRRRVFTNLPQWWRNAFSLTPASGVAHDSFVWRDRVYASDLGAHYALRLPTLETEGPLDWGLEDGELVAPMPRDDHETGTLVAYGLKRSASGDRLRFVEVDKRFKRTAESPSFGLRGVVHDVAFTKSWYVAVQSPLQPKLVPALLGIGPLWSALDTRDEGPTISLAPRGRSGEVVHIRLTTNVRTAFHILNAYEDGDEVVVDFIGYEGVVPFHLVMRQQPDEYRALPTNRILRARLRPKANTADVESFEAQGEAPEVAPALHGKPYTCAWYAALPSGDAKEPNAYVLTRRIGRLDVTDGTSTIWDAGKSHLVSPPAFAPDPDADDPEAGWILAWDLDLESETTDAVVLAADDLAAGPVARIKLGVYLPATSHCRFAPELRLQSP